MRCLHALAAIAPSSPVTARRFFATSKKASSRPVTQGRSPSIWGRVYRLLQHQDIKVAR
jgi:hypothetical protein